MQIQDDLRGRQVGLPRLDANQQTFVDRATAPDHAPVNVMQDERYRNMRLRSVRAKDAAYAHGVARREFECIATVLVLDGYSEELNLLREIVTFCGSPDRRRKHIDGA